MLLRFKENYKFFNGIVQIAFLNRICFVILIIRMLNGMLLFLAGEKNKESKMDHCVICLNNKNTKTINLF